MPPGGDGDGLRRVGTTGMTEAIVERIAIAEAARETAAARLVIPSTATARRTTDR